jgi:hypothetical protein
MDRIVRRINAQPLRDVLSLGGEFVVRITESFSALP